MSAGRRVVLVKHANDANDDRCSTHLAALGYRLDYRHPYAGDRLPGADDDVAGTVVFGGGQPITEAQRYPFLKDEMDWIERCLARDIPVLGICLGAQLLAHSLGADVGPHPEGQREFGYYRLHPTDAGEAFFGAGLHVTLSHYHGFGLPRGATLLARSDLFPHQAIRVGDNCFGFQFHPECTATIFRRWQAAGFHADDLPGVQTRAERERGMAAYDAEQHRWFIGFLDRWLGANRAA